jgi:hypothetical protein
MFPLIVDRMKFIYDHQVFEPLPMVPTHHPYQLYDAYQ